MTVPAAIVAFSHLLLVSYQVHIKGIVTIFVLKPSQEPGQPVVDFDMMVLEIDAGLPGLPMSRFMTARVIGEMFTCFGETDGSTAAGAQNKNVLKSSWRWPVTFD